MSDPLLEIKNLVTGFETESGLLKAVDGVSFTVPKGTCVGIVGESGCGKSVTAMSIVRLLPQPMGKILDGQILFKGRDLVQAKETDMHGIRGRHIGVIFQEPMTALNPVHSIGRQIGVSDFSIVIFTFPAFLTYHCTYRMLLGKRVIISHVVLQLPESIVIFLNTTFISFFPVRQVYSVIIHFCLTVTNIIT